MGATTRVEPFSTELIVHEFGREPYQGTQHPTVHYLVGYLKALNASVCLLEERYIDRHFIDEFTTYYARSFCAPDHSCKRLHFFKQLDHRGLGKHLDDAILRGEYNRAQSELEKHYLGFVVRRPLELAPIGRTVLRTYPGDADRKYEALRRYEVNLLGLRLHVTGLAFQAQDRAVAACASISLWSALQRVAHIAGHRSPTPGAITRAAASPYPASHGLDAGQMARAIDNLGYIADYVEPGSNRALFRALLTICLQSQLPVVLLMLREENLDSGKQMAGHAVAVTGYRESAEIVEVPFPQKGIPPVLMRAGSTKVVYVHDDNLGSHAHYELFESDEIAFGPIPHPKLKLRRGKSDLNAAYWTPDEWDVVGALIPKPDKLRTPILDIFKDVAMFRRLLGRLTPNPLSFSIRVTTGVEYRRGLLEGRPTTDRTQLRAFQEALELPKFVSIITATDGDKVLCDLILDVSEVHRHSKTVRGMVAHGIPARSQAHKVAEQVAEVLSCPLITASATKT